MSPLFRALRSLGNGLGFAWWARVETFEPDVTYWFGPFLRKKSLDSHLTKFLLDLSGEGVRSVEHRHHRCRRVEPFTN